MKPSIITKVKLIVFAILFCASSKAQTGKYFANSKPVIVWPMGNVKEKTATVSKNGTKLIASFDGKLINFICIKGSIRSNLINLNEAEGWDKIEVALYDFNKDGNKEIIIARGFPGAILKVSVWSCVNGVTKHLGDFDGQSVCEFYKNKLILPYGFQGLFFEYSFTKGKFTQTQ